MSKKYNVFDSEDPSIYSTAGSGSSSFPPSTMLPPSSIQSTLKSSIAPIPTNTLTSTETAAQNGAELREIVRKFMESYNNKVKVYILTPVYSSTVYVDYMTSLIQTISLFRDLNIPLQVEYCKNDSLVTRGRNNLVARAMNDPEMTHVMFIDADISWTPESVIKLLLSEKDVVCGIYPLKHYHLNRLLTDPMNPYNSNVVKTWLDKKNNSQLREFITDEQAIQYNLLRYNVNFISNELTINNNIAEIRHAPTGFIMIRRTVFEKLFRSYPGLQYVDDVGFAREGEERYSFNIFDTAVEMMPDGKNHLLSEDFLFCERYRKINPEKHKVYCDVSINLGHSGTNTYHGSFISSLL